MQETRNFIANALGLRLYRTNLSIWSQILLTLSMSDSTTNDAEQVCKRIYR